MTGITVGSMAPGRYASYCMEGIERDRRGGMRRLSLETGDYLNPAMPQLALIAKGIPLPAGQWLRVGDESMAPWVAEAFVGELFPALSGRNIPFVALLTDFDVEEFERGHPPAAD